MGPLTSLGIKYFKLSYSEKDLWSSSGKIYSFRIYCVGDTLKARLWDKMHAHAHSAAHALSLSPSFFISISWFLKYLVFTIKKKKKVTSQWRSPADITVAKWSRLTPPVMHINIMYLMRCPTSQCIVGKETQFRVKCIRFVLFILILRLPSLIQFYMNESLIRDS